MTQKSPSESPDLQALVSAASRHIEHAADKHARQESHAVGNFVFAYWPKIFLVVVAIAVLFAQGAELQRQFFGVPQGAVQLQAESVLTAARAAVEQHRKTNGSLPDRVPLAALDAMVSLESNDGSYQLTLVLDGKKWQMDHQGTFSGSK